MQEIVTGSFAPCDWRLWPPVRIRVIDWNIDRGSKLPAIVDFLSAQNADLLVLQEADLNTRRAGNANVAEEIARRLDMDYVFGREFQELGEGSKDSPAYTGQAVLSRWRLCYPRLIRFERQSNFWRPRWWVPNAPIFQERLGGRIALVTEIEGAGRRLTVYNLHLESRGNHDIRLAQMEEVLEDAARHPFQSPTLIAGDLNFDASCAFRTGAIQDFGFRSALGLPSPYTTPARGLFQRQRTIDWAFVSGPVEATLGHVHNDIYASDHYPISFTIRFS